MLVGLWLIAGGAAAGLFGSLLGLGGGVLIVPLLTLVFGLPLLTAVGVSLVCVIVTSGASAGVYLERRVANLRLGMTLELFTATGALVGGLVAFLLPEKALEVLFAGLLIYTRITMAPARPRRRAGARARTTRRRRATEPGERPVLRREPVRPDATASTAGPGRRSSGSVGAGVVVGAAGDRRRDRQGAGHAPRDGRPAAGRDRHEQPDDRDHGVGRRDRLPARAA